MKQKRMKYNPGVPPDSLEQVQSPEEVKFPEGLEKKLTHSISILQEPTKARMCGINTSIGKRLLDPPLVIQLHVDERNLKASSVPGREPSDHSENENRGMIESEFICLVSLCQADEEFSIGFCKSVKELYARDGSFKTRIAGVLIGQTCRIPSYYSISSKSASLPLFVFHDLAIRLNGIFRLKCTCVNLSTGETEIAYTKTFQVYVPQSFPGLDEPTRLSKILYSHGVPIRAGVHSNTELARRILSSPPEKKNIPDEVEKSIEDHKSTETSVDEEDFNCDDL